LVRTQSSEQYALFDLDQTNAEQQPATIGKLDLHYTGEGVYGTLLLWDMVTRALKPALRSEFVNTLLAEITQPMGVPNEYVIEFFMPDLDEYELFHNVAVTDEEETVYEPAPHNGADHLVTEPETHPPHRSTHRSAQRS
jgi:hypothetical protein